MGSLRSLRFKNLIGPLFSTLKGSAKDPFFYLGVICVALFLAVDVTAPSFASKTLLPVSNIASQPSTLFATPGIKIQESPELSLIQKNSLAAISPPIMVTPQILGALIDAADYDGSQKEITEYLVQPGENLWSIAEKFNISLETVLWANDLSKNTAIQIGQSLIIPPISGVIYHIKKGDTISEIAQVYKAEKDKIVTFNNLATEDDIYIGDIIMVPDGVMPPPTMSAPSYVPIASSYFIIPIIAPYKITQGLHWYNAIDFTYLSESCGKPILAAAAGNVLKVKLTSSTSKWAFGGGGNNLTILHPNGVVTYYGHIQSSFVNPGDYVYQGQIIALMGGAKGTPGAGTSTGCHVHFGVTGTKNPFAK